MPPSNAYHYIGGAGAKLWGQPGSCKERKRGEPENIEDKDGEQREPLVELIECRQLIEINVLSGWAKGRERFRLAVRELDV